MKSYYVGQETDSRFVVVLKSKEGTEETRFFLDFAGALEYLQRAGKYGIAEIQRIVFPGGGRQLPNHYGSLD